MRGGPEYGVRETERMRYRSGARQPQDDDLGASHLGFRIILMAPAP